MSDLGDLRWMLPPLALCLVLTVIHGYLGIHVLARKVIFVDLALAQVAALGSTYALFLGHHPADDGDGAIAYCFSLGFTIVGAAVFALARMRHERVPQEAFIGIVYAMASALAILILAKAPSGAEHIKDMLVGNVLLVTWPTVVKTAAIYTAIGAFHLRFRRLFIEISVDPEGAIARGRRVRLWDFLFYVSFGLVITSSVAVAGVLLVFSFLVVPAVIAFMFRDGIGARILCAWAVGTVCSAVGMLLSYYGDLPTGPSVVVCFAAVLIVAALAYYVRTARARAHAALKVSAGAALVVAAISGSLLLRKPPPEHAHAAEFTELAAALGSPDESTQIEAIHHLARLADPHAVQPLLRVLDGFASDRVVEHILQVLPDLGAAAGTAAPAIERVAQRKTDPYLRLEAAAALLRLRSASGFRLLEGVLAGEPPLLVEQKSGELLRQHAGSNFGVGSSEATEERRRARARLRRWLDDRGPGLRFRPDRQRFE